MSIPAVDKSLPVPLYHQIKCALQDAIELGEWQLDQQLPNENQLAENFGVSKITIRQALQELADLGYIRRERGRGTFVSRPKFDHGPRELTSFTEEMRRHKLSAGSRVLERGVVEAEGRVAEALEVKRGERVFLLKRLRLAGGEPMGIQTAHLPVKLAPGLVDEDFENGSLYESLRTRWGLEAARARETYTAATADAGPAELLGITAGAPVFVVERIAYLASGTPLEFVQSLMRGDRYSVVLELAAERRVGGRR